MIDPNERAEFIGQHHIATAHGWRPHPRYEPDEEGHQKYRSQTQYPGEDDKPFDKMQMVHPDFPDASLTISGRQGWYHSDSRGYGMGSGKTDASLSQYLRKFHQAPHLAPDEMQKFDETAATPMPRMGVGLAKAGSLAKSLGSSAKAPSSSVAGSVPKLKSAGSSFAERLIQRVVAGEDPVSVAEGEELSIERQASDVSPKGATINPGKIRPGMHIGIRGPRHNGFHVVDTIEGGIITMKGEDGHMESLPLSDLNDHEVVHALENV